MQHDRTLPARAEFERLLFHWPAVVKAAENAWARNFALSVAAQARRRHWRPSAKQIGIMRRMVNELFIEAEQDLIEVLE